MHANAHSPAPLPHRSDALHLVRVRCKKHQGACSRARVGSGVPRVLAVWGAAVPWPPQLFLCCAHACSPLVVRRACPLSES